MPENLGLIRSIDRGETWEPTGRLGTADYHVLRASGPRLVAVNAEEPDLSISAGRPDMAEANASSAAARCPWDPNEPTRMVVVTDEGVFTSSDEGRSWRQREATPSEQLVWPASDVLYRADPGGLIKRSADGGDTWKDTGSPGIGVNDLTADHAGALYASVPGGEVQRSTDRGASWRRHLVLR